MSRGPAVTLNNATMPRIELASLALAFERPSAEPAEERPAARPVVRGRAARAVSPGRLRLGLVDRDSGFRLVLAKRLEDLGWDYRPFSRPVLPARLVPMGLDVVVVDLEILGRARWSWLEAVDRAEGRPAIVVCAGSSSSSDRVRALRLGVDDWLSKPCHPEELIARVEAVVRQRHRLASLPPDPVVVGELEVRPAEYQAYVKGRSLKLTRREFQVVEVMVKQPKTILPRERIYELIWGGRMPRDDRAVDVVVHKVRRKLLDVSPLWRYIHTHQAVGYSFAPTSLEPGMPAASDPNPAA
ncbi:MAG TPA: response regulator transcription factor [Solirubrobacteraceae bacterium]|nr:response regulator transcription factor [Solirubrobacteraceae bacterium]